MTNWTINKARETYSLTHWGSGYFDVNDRGHIVVRPNQDNKSSGIDMFELIQKIHDQGLSLPVLVRFTDILHHRVDVLCDAFATAMAKQDYQGRYTAVYPIKVNQQHSVVREILLHGRGRVGLEAGSKPELMAVLALSEAKGGVIICNGYKDREYIRLALIGKQLGHRITIVVEKLSELNLVIEESKALNITPLLGLRVRLASIGQGKWQNTGGEKAKFGLSAQQVLTLIQRCRDAGLLDTVKLLHFHLGSQIANLRDIQRGAQEAARFYSELHALGVAISTVDVGGGLGVDYEGTRSRSFCSMNYSVHDYAATIVATIAECCAENTLPQPDVITESGRAMTAHHAVLLTDVIDTERVPDKQTPVAIQDDAPQAIKELQSILQNITQRSVVESYHDAGHALSDAQEGYTRGSLTLAQRAQAETEFYAICHAIHPLLQGGAKAHQDILNELNEKLADKYFCNFSVFQSAPDIWAIDQIFPIVPVHRLDEEPTRRVVIEDLTCDSDGRVDYYVDKAGIESTLPLHDITKEDDYVLGIFLVGAYQEILGDMHNLFGDTHSINVELTPEGGYQLTQAQQGETVDDVLKHVRFDKNSLLNAYRDKVSQADVSDEQGALYLAELVAGLEGYTYLED